MGKHNGKSRSTGLKVGAALANRSKKVRQTCPTERLQASSNGRRLRCSKHFRDDLRMLCPETTCTQQIQNQTQQAWWKPTTSIPSSRWQVCSGRPESFYLPEVLNRSSSAFIGQAELADRDFSAQRGETVVLSTGEKPNADDHEKAAARRAAELRNQHR